MTVRRLDPDLARCSAALPDGVREDVLHLAQTLPMDDLMPAVRAAREGTDDDAHALFLLGRLHQRAISRAYQANSPS